MSKKKVYGKHPVTKENLYKKDVDSITNNVVDTRLVLEKDFPNVPKITLLHLSIAICLNYPIYVTENPDLNDRKDYIKQTYNIQVGYMYEFTNFDAGVVL